MKVDNVRLTAFAAAALMVIGALGTWAALDSDDLISVNGTDRDGSIIIGCAVAYAIAVLLYQRRFYLLFAAFAALIAAVTAIVDLQDVESTARVHAGWGLWLDAAASLVAFLMVVALRRRPRAKP